MQRTRLRYVLYTLTGGISASLVYQTYKWIWQAPRCPNYDKKQKIGIHHPLTCTVRILALEQLCSGRVTMKKIGAVTGVNFQLIRKASLDAENSSFLIHLNENPIALRNLFNDQYTEDYVHTLADLIMKLDDEYRSALLSNKIGYYVYVCPECHSTSTRRMISCTSYLYNAALSDTAVDVSQIR